MSLIGAPDCASDRLLQKAAMVSGATTRFFIATAHYSNANMRFQSFFMLITVQPSFFASS
jgi:hypothetical protein